MRAFLLALFLPLIANSQAPNVIIFYTDDLGFGDPSCYGASKLYTPNIDRLAAGGLRFTNAHTTSATCTPSRYALLTGRYPWRKQGTGVLPGDAALIIEPSQSNLASLFKQAGYQTAVVGKWHLGLGETLEKNWNAEISPGPRELGFDYSFIFPATADRVPTVFLENQKVVGLDPYDPIAVNYKTPVGNDPTGKEHPELLKMKSSPGQGHDQTIVNGIGRIGYMYGGYAARWSDEEVSLSFLAKARGFMEENKHRPFFLYFSLTEPHVPRMPSTQFKGKSGLGYRGDAILQLDWTLGEILNQLKYLGIEKNTLLIFSSDNGPVLDDGYQDGAVTQLNGHQPAGPYRGGKYSLFEAGTRVPFIVSWPGTVKPGVSSALVSQVDLLASFRQLLKVKSSANEQLDSENQWNTLVGKDAKGRSYVVEHANGLALVKGKWKYIEPRNGPKLFKEVNIESGYDGVPQLYDLEKDPGERLNVTEKNLDVLREMVELLERVRKRG
jgi:arylsulfatase A-like enzyme